MGEEFFEYNGWHDERAGEADIFGVAGTFEFNGPQTGRSELVSERAACVRQTPARFGGKLGFTEPFLARVAEAVLATYGDVYPETNKHRDAILRTLTLEEQRFQRTVDVGIANLNALLSELEAR